MNEQIICKKKKQKKTPKQPVSFHMDLILKLGTDWAHVCRTVVCRHQPHSLTTLTNSVDFMPHHCLAWGEQNANGWAFAEVLGGTSHLPVLWPCFATWLSLVGAFWLYLAHLISKMAWFSYLKGFLLLKKTHPVCGFSSFTQGLMIILFLFFLRFIFSFVLINGF